MDRLTPLNAAGCERVFEDSMSGNRADRPQLAAAGRRPGSTIWRDPCASFLTTVNILTAHQSAVATREHRHHQRDWEADPPYHRRPWTIRSRAFRVSEPGTALATSRARGRIGGPPSALNAIKVRAAQAMLASGAMTGPEVARQVGCSSSTFVSPCASGRDAVAESQQPSGAPGGCGTRQSYSIA